MATDEPMTEAGRALYRDILIVVSVLGPASVIVHDVDLRDRILAIEAEAAAAARAESEALRPALNYVVSQVRVWEDEGHLGYGGVLPRVATYPGDPYDSMSNIEDWLDGHGFLAARDGAPRT